MRLNIMKALTAGAALLIALGAYAFASGSDYETEQEAERLYFENVCILEIWPDYKNIKPCN